MSAALDVDPKSSWPSGDATKRFREGTDRAVMPEQTLARLLPHLGAMGITRLADVTGLDRVGVPTVLAIRPNSRSIAVHQGKGLTRTAAKVAAIMEGAESFHAETMGAPLRHARVGELGAAAAAIERLPRVVGAAPDLGAERLLWTAGRDLATGATRFVPYEVVHADYTAPQLAPSLFQATTSGLGAGNSPLEAVLHGLCEVIENDAVALWHGAGAARGPAARPIDPSSVEDARCRALLAAFAGARTDVAIFDATSDVGLAALICLAVPRDEGLGGVEPEIGAGCHPDPAVALARALVEAAQSRLARISGARDDFPPESYGTAARAHRRREAQAWLAASRLSARSFAAMPDRAGPTLRHDLDALLTGIACAGCVEAIWVELTRPDLAIPVGRVIVPGLAGPWTDDGSCTPGVRAGGVLS